MTTNIKHSAQRLPKLYNIASKIVQKVKEEKGSVKSLVYGARHPNLKALYALVIETLKHGQQLDYLVRKTQILLKNPKLNPWVARVLMTELLWQKKVLRAVSPPQEIVQSYQEQFISELAQIPKDEVNWDASKSTKTAAQPIRYVRVNTLKDTVENVINWFISVGWEEVTQDYDSKTSALKLSSRQFKRDADIPDILVFPHDFRFYETNFYRQGVILLQDKASCVPPLLLNPPPGSVVLDMCAAPGMKASQIAAIMENKGKVIAVEIHKTRYDTLCETAEKFGATCVKPVHDDALRYSGPDMSDVEYILLDPPCSGSGMAIRKDVFAEQPNKDSQRLTKLANFQCNLLRHAMTNFPKVKRIVYSTCSVHVEENEAVVDSVLKSIPPNFVPVRNPPSTDWMTRGSSDYEFGDCGFYTLPATHLTNGFFVMVFERSDHKYVPSSNSSVEQSGSVEDKADPVKKKKQKRKKAVDNGAVEGKSDKPDNVVQKMMRAMQKTPQTDVSESHPDAVDSDHNQSTKKKMKKRKLQNVQGDGVNTDEAGSPVKKALVEKKGDGDHSQIGQKKRKSSWKIEEKGKKLKQ